MARFHVITDAETGETTTVPFTPEEEAAADAASVVALYSGADVDVERERRIALPLGVALPSGSFRINMDPESQRNIQGLSTAGILLSSAAPTQKTTFRDYDNVSHDLLPSDLVQMGLQVMARIQAVYQKAWALKAISPIPADYADDSHW